MKTKKRVTKKSMQKELDMFRKLSMHIVANKIFLEYKLASSITPIEPEKFVEDALKANFPRLEPRIKREIWLNFLTNLVMVRNLSGKGIIKQ